MSLFGISSPENNSILKVSRLPRGYPCEGGIVKVPSEMARRLVELLECAAPGVVIEKGF